MTKINNHQQLLSHLKRVLQKERIIFSLAGLVTSGAVVLSVWLILSLVAQVMIMPVWLKIGLLVISFGVAVYVLSKYAVSRFFHGSVESVATALEKKYPDLKGRLIASVQFARNRPSGGYSSELVDMTVRQAVERSGGLDLSRIITFNPIWKSARMFGAAAVAALLILALLPGIFSHSYEVYSNPTDVIAPPLGYHLTAVPGQEEWIKYRDIDIGAALTGDHFPDKAIIHHRLAGGNWQETEVDLSKMRRLPIQFGDSLLFTTTLRQINKSFDFYVEAGRVKTEIQKVDVVDRPRVNGIKLSVFYPDYTGLEPTVIDENNGSFSAVTGSRATIQIETNLPVESAEMVFDDDSRTPLAVTDQVADASVVVEKSQTYRFHLVDHLGEENPDPIEYYITAVPDEYPSIDVLRPGFDVNLNDEMILPLKVRIFDDYGFSSLALKYQIVSDGQPSEEHVAVLHYSDRIKTEGEIEFNWDMDQLNLFPGDYVLYYLEVADNDRISGPKISSSRQFIARLPSLEEIISETENDAEQRVDKTEELLKRGREIQKRMEQANRKLESKDQQSKKNSDWQQQKELESAAKDNQEFLQQLEEAARDMQQSLDKMQDNSLMSREIMEKLAQIQKLWEEVATPEMMEAQKKLMDALKDMDPKELEEALKKMDQSQDELLARLERQLELLKRMQVEQKMEAMIRKAEKLAEDQDNQNKEAESAKNEDLPQMSQKEEGLKSDLEQLRQDAKDLKKMMDGLESPPPPEADKFNEAIENTDADENMQDMADAMKQQQKESAKKEGKTAHSKLMEMLDEMQQQMMAMKGQNQQDLNKQMQLAIHEANHLSQTQEKLHDRVAELDPRSAVMQEMARSQTDLAGSCNGLRRKIAELAKATPFIAADMMAKVNEAMDNMGAATENFNGRKSNSGLESQRDAMSNLNEVAMQLMESMQKQKECNNGSNCSNPMQQLQSMCDKQNDLNQETKNQCNNPNSRSNGKIGQSEREALQRLAENQKGIRKSMEQLDKELGGRRQILGRLDDIAKEMKKVEEALESGDVGSETTERQLKIFSRMLEATRSLQRKDFSEQRQAESAKSQAFVIPKALSNDILNNQGALEDRLRQYLGDNYPPQYEEQIKAYFKALLQSESQSPGQAPTN